MGTVSRGLPSCPLPSIGLAAIPAAAAAVVPAPSVQAAIRSCCQGVAPGSDCDDVGLRSSDSYKPLFVVPSGRIDAGVSRLQEQQSRIG